MTNPSVYVRPNRNDLGEIPLDNNAMTIAIASLAPRTLAVWTRLNWHLWNVGELPVSYRRLAEVGGVTPSSFAKMVPALAPLFDHDGSGRWQDHTLEAKRNTCLGLDPGQRISFELPEDEAGRAVDESLSEKRRASGAKGLAKRWGARADRLQLLPGGKSEDGKAEDGANDGAGDVLPSPDSKMDSKNGAEDADRLPPFLSSRLPSGASGAQSLSDRPDSLPSKENNVESDGRTDARDAGAPPDGDGKIDPSADGKIARTPDSKTGPGPDGKIDPAVDGKQPPTDAEVIAAMRAIAGGKIPGHLLTSFGISPIRDLLAGGCDLTRDVVPAFEGCVAGLSKPLQSLKAKFIHEAAMANRDEALRAKAVPARSPKVFVVRDSAEWLAWCERLGRKSFPSAQAEVGGQFRFGWYFDKQWPSGADPEACRRKAAELKDGG